MFWINVYAFVLFDVDLFQVNNGTIVIKGEGVKNEFRISLTELKSEEYLQIVDKEFNFLNSVGNQYSEIYSGVSLGSLLQVKDMLLEDPAELTFRFYSLDGYVSPMALNLSLATTYMEDVILAYELDGSSMDQYTGPVRSVINRNVIPDLANSQYAVKQLNQILIEIV
ncbi:MAG: molybdopterin-dependent oxidoreductase [Candidatus Lokiarchaeota archaeon]|nr:molybdopterin-dependent oxidoreductase [Candidatus Lokiarchaeota archaeon]